jgi:hypothetical protein
MGDGLPFFPLTEFENSCQHYFLNFSGPSFHQPDDADRLQKAKQ